jgi:uncharacterized protein (TIGR02996 family)
MGYVIEKAPTGRSSCKHCGTLIDEGVMRFGTAYKRRPKWWHLTCAVESSPRMFKAYAKTHKIPAAPKAPKKKAAKMKPGRAPDPAMVAAMRADREDTKARLVFADWLQAAGDPWGEIIALEINEHQAKAKKIFSAHRVELEGDFSPKHLAWEGGFITQAVIRGGLAQVKQRVRDLAALRASILLEMLTLEVPSDRELAELISRELPQITYLAIGEGDLGALALPALAELRIELEDPDAVALAPLFASRKLPILSSLELAGPKLELAAGVIEGLVASPLFKQLDALTFDRLRLAPVKKTLLAHRRTLGRLAVRFTNTDLVNDRELHRAFRRED